MQEVCYTLQYYARQNNYRGSQGVREETQNENERKCENQWVKAGEIYTLLGKKMPHETRNQ